ncbi:MAG: hypothetical protein HY777_02320 [Betaproteobacteria bacterium]|nr:hypothetical protein [Betaproteobacteria bacterium]
MGFPGTPYLVALDANRIGMERTGRATPAPPAPSSAGDCKGIVTAHRFWLAWHRQATVAKHPRFNMHFTPTSASWIDAIDEYIAHHNTKPKPFIWTKSARDILEKVIRANSRLSSKQNATLH